MITIYGRANSSNVRKVLWLCDDIGLAFERLDYGRGYKDASSPELLALNPHARVPVIKDGDTAVWESNTCLRYLAAKYGPPEIYPTELAARARVDQWMDWQLSAFQPAFMPIASARLRNDPAYQSPESIAPAIERVTKMMAILSGQIDKAGGFIAAGNITIADMAIGIGLHRWFVLVPEADNPKPLIDYHERLKQRPGFKKWVDTPRP